MILCENFSHIPQLEYCFYSSFVLVLVVLDPAPMFPICHKRQCLLWSWKTGEDSFQRRKSFLIISMQHNESVYFDRFWNPLLRDQRTYAYKELASQVKKNRNNQLQLPAGKLSLFQMEHELGLLLRNKTIEPRIRVQVYTHQIINIQIFFIIS